MTHITPSIVKKRLGRVIAYNTAFSFLPGVSVPGAVFLSQVAYWSKNSTSESRDGWFYKKQCGDDSWEDETGLSLKQQVSARAALVELGILEERRRDVPAKLWYRVNYDRLLELQENSLPFKSKNKKCGSSVIESIVGRLIAYYPDFTLLPGISVTGAVFLSQAFYWSDNITAKSRGGWFYKKQRGEDSWESETGLSPKQQANARKSLAKLGILKEERIGVPAIVWYRVDCERLLELLVEHVELKNSSKNRSSQFHPLGESDLPLGESDLPYSQSDKPNSTFQNRQKGKSITENTSKITARKNRRTAKGDQPEVDNLQQRRAAALQRSEQIADNNAKRYGDTTAGEPAMVGIRKGMRKGINKRNVGVG
ncbi:hypothetical protein [Halomonas sp. SpR8]|uniref:hypothetical protein n=1 Tax=Halomonas sp. SpR8 TaxID=3050463 RepID=UPI0027E57535|nr:hypothetical protein [Halomonas sp. SpR8]MDQ7728730.1 hypothetical protein [Halomonas sp. SpR8]